MLSSLAVPKLAVTSCLPRGGAVCSSHFLLGFFVFVKSKANKSHTVTLVSRSPRRPLLGRRMTLAER